MKSAPHRSSANKQMRLFRGKRILEMPRAAENELVWIVEMVFTWDAVLNY